MCRKIYSNDNFKSSQWTDLEYEYSAQTHEFLSSHKQYSMTDTNLIEMQKCYSSLWSVWTIKKIESPIIFAISFYYNAWTSHYLEQSGVNLSIMLESLFAPLSNTELSHQIAYNFCWFIGTDIESRRRLYSFCKKFYSLRSKIVHGNVPDQNELVTLIPEMFRHCSDVLKKILLNEELLHIFDDKKKKDEFFKKNIFNHSP
ncbi:hypothetical protein COY95_02090 [Candidatus Woesearchaeota archaeon CG_4_10_14_0_8_um_filter_47_5]|nr:MAG: hypothetical protein COY95_02090 [Candidatus Woesearchaeota archaeon CG_4_10_14_0_8_um_filter_47_5]